MNSCSRILRTAGLLIVLAAMTSFAPASRAQEFDPEQPYKIAPDGTVDWYVYNGYRRYSSTCVVCHGPDGLGSSFAPALVESLKRLTYDQFADVVVNGRKNVTTATESVMPSFGTNVDVMCYLNDIYAYLKARSDGVVGRGRPPKNEPKPPAAKAAEESCRGSP